MSHDQIHSAQPPSPPKFCLVFFVFCLFTTKPLTPFSSGTMILVQVLVLVLVLVRVPFIVLDQVQGLILVVVWLLALIEVLVRVLILVLVLFLNPTALCSCLWLPRRTIHK